MSSAGQQFVGPGFVTAIFDIPFPISIPNGAYLTFDPVKQVGCVEITLREGSRAFFRNRPITGPTSFSELLSAVGAQRPREGRAYVAVSALSNGTRKATLNIETGENGGYAECKYYSQVSVTFLVDDFRAIEAENAILARAFPIVNAFLDKYRLLNEDYRVARVSSQRNYYFAACHISPLTADELHLSPQELFRRLSEPRTFHSELGHGGTNIIRTNSFELLGPRSQLSGGMLTTFESLIQTDYEMPLSYHLILEALANLQRYRDYRLAIVHAETAFEVFVVNSLVRLMVDSGMPSAEAYSRIENDSAYWGVKRKIRQLDNWSGQYCARNSIPFTAFVNSGMFSRWESALYDKRNAAVHAGADAFSYPDASSAVGVSKECIAFLDGRIPSMANRVQLDSSMAGFRENAGEVMF